MRDFRYDGKRQTETGERLERHAVRCSGLARVQRLGLCDECCMKSPRPIFDSVVNQTAQRMASGLDEVRQMLAHQRFLVGIFLQYDIEPKMREGTTSWPIPT